MLCFCNLLLCFAYACACDALSIWPQPSHVEAGSATFWMNPKVTFTYVDISGSRLDHHQDGQQVPINNLFPTNSSEDAKINVEDVIQTAIYEARNTLFHEKFVPWKFHKRNSEFEPPLTKTKSIIRNIVLQQIAPATSSLLNPSANDVDESYRLDIDEFGDVLISANSSIGISRGLVTFTQLFYTHSSGDVYTNTIPITIIDQPKFPHRGINVDVARNFFPVTAILKTINAVAYNKLNRLHLHITDGQSWPLVVPALPELAFKGALRQDMVYTPEQVQEIQRYGALRGVQIYLEVDMPGHTSSIAHAYPELIASYNIQPDWARFAAEPPSGTLKLNSTEVMDFLETLLNDVLPRVKPYSRYWHTGGDEVNLNAYLNDETIRSSDPKLIATYMQRFVDHMHNIVRRHGLVPIVWEEMLLHWNLTLGDDVVVQSWRSDAGLADIVGKGYKALAGNFNYWYLDCGHGQWINFEHEDTASAQWPYADYCSPRKNWRLIYSYDPLAGIPDATQHLVLGGECHIWTEQTDEFNLDSMIWPRSAAVAEVLWSGAKDAAGHNRSHTTAAPRLAEMRERLVAKGVRAEPVQIPFCLMSSGQCNM